jgi:hypothetical protein
LRATSSFLIYFSGKYNASRNSYGLSLVSRPVAE